MRLPRPLRSCAAWCLACAALSCSSPEPVAAEAPAPPRPSAAAPWTDAFRERAVLIADRVRIEGPPGLLEHVATRPDPELHERVERTTTEGFLQELRAKASFPGSQIQAWLDGLEIAALRQLTVLERPGPCPVKVVAEGQAVWRSLERGTERREPRLELVGPSAP